MSTGSPRLVLLFMLGAAIGCQAAAPASEITDFLPGLRDNPTPGQAALRVYSISDLVAFPDWGAARIELQEWISRDPLAPWVSLLKCRSRVPAADWQLLHRELLIMARFHVMPQYKMLLTEWEDDIPGFPKGDVETWQKLVDKASRKLGLLTMMASENVLHDWERTADFLWVQNLDVMQKAVLVDLAVNSWAGRKGFDEPVAWLLEAGRAGSVWNLPAAWTAVDVFPAKPEVAAKLLARVEDPIMRQVAIHAIAARSPSPESLEVLHSFIDAKTWQLITSR